MAERLLGEQRSRYDRLIGGDKVCNRGLASDSRDIPYVPTLALLDTSL